MGTRDFLLETALNALDRGRSSPSAPHEPRGTLLSFWADRVDLSPEIFAERERLPVLTAEELSADYRIEPERLVTWLRAGLPFVDEGDFTTGAGFSFRAAHVYDWLCAMVLIAGSVAERQRMKIEDYGRRR